MTVVTFIDGYRDRPTTRRGALEDRVRQLKCASWADPGDDELRELLGEAEAALRAFDRVSHGGAS